MKIVSWNMGRGWSGGYRTFWGKDPDAPRSVPPIQDDHIFTDLATFERNTVCEVLDDATWHRLSDHAPIVVRIDDP